MGTVLRVLVVIILILSGAALFLAIQLYGKRELLINRTHLLEEQFRKVARTIEAAEPPAVVQPNYVSKDISPVTSKEMDNPERSPFWNSYQYILETPNLPPMNWDSNEMQLQLRHYYQTTVGTDGKIIKVKHAVNQGEFSTEGPGTMRQILDELLDRATKQLATLNKTRLELQKLREELATTIEEHNKLKQEGRADKKTIDDLRKEIDNLREQIRGLERKVANLEEEKKALTAELAEAKSEIERQKTNIEELTKQVKDQLKEITELRGKMRVGSRPISEQTEAFKGTPGVKGKVAAVDESLKFVVVELSEQAMTELLGEQRDGNMPQVELMVRRPGFKSPTGEFITRIKFRQILRQKNLVVADILIDWQQSPVAKDDVVFF